jgi:hypothetical protein
VVSIDRPCFNTEPLIFLFCFKGKSLFYVISKNQFQCLKPKMWLLNIFGEPVHIADSRKHIHITAKSFPVLPVGNWFSDF